MSQNVAQGGAGAPAEFFKTSKPAQAFAALDPSESLAEGIGSSYAVIGYKGKILSIRYRGETHVLVRPDDGTPIGYIDVVILRSAKVKAKSWYPGGFEENASSGKRPDCASIDGVTPDGDVTNKQASLCAICPRNEWKTDANGRKGRDCTDYKRLAVLILPNQTVRLFGQPLMEPAFLRVPPDSLNDLAVFGDNMAQQGWPFSSFITRISFDPAKSHPKFMFKALQGLSDAEASTVLGLREDMQAKRITGEDEIARRVTTAALINAKAGQQNGTAPSPAVPGGVPASVTQQVAPSRPPAPATPPASQGQTVVEALPNPGLGFTLSNTVQQETRVQTQLAPPPPTLTQDARTAQTMQAVLDLPAQGGGAFGLTATQVEPNPNPQPGAMVGQTADDVGDGVEDADLDAKIAAMLQTGG